VDQVVTQVTTATTLTSSPNPSSSGQAVTFTAAVTGGGGPVTSGTVDISEGGTTLATGLALAADGTATFTTAALAVGTHTITAAYSGTATLASSTGSVDQVVSLAASTTSVTSSLNPSSTGDAVTFTATVTSSAPVTTGTVQFSDDGAPLGSPQAVAADGSASVTTAELAAGNHTITAAYSGTATFGASTGSVDQTVNLVADAGGPYTVAEGDSLTLDGTGSSAADSYSWDLNGDGDFTDATGPTPTLTWSALEALGIDDGPSTHAVSLRVTGGTSTTTSAAGALTVTNTGPTAVITDSLTATVGHPLTIKVGADDPSSADMAATFTYTVDWGDGSPVVTVDGPADPPVTHTYSTVGSVSATFAVTDKDGGTSGPTTVTVTVQPASNGGPPQQSDEGTSSPVDEGSLAHTGADGTNDLSVLGTVLVLGGAGLLYAVRRRRRTVLARSPGSHR
jgi:LPXTG-motif cell wall-anchored protein